MSESEHINNGCVAQFLCKGSENAVPLDELRKVCGCETVRDLTRQIEKERKDGVLILSGSKGIFLASDGEQGKTEVRTFCRSMLTRAESIIKIVRIVSQSADVLPDREEDGEVEW